MRNCQALHRSSEQTVITQHCSGLLNTRTIKWLVDDAWEVKVSIDGLRSVHDRLRLDPMGIGTFDRIERHVRTLSQKIPERFSTTSVLCKGPDSAQIFDGIAGLGVRTFEIIPAFATWESDVLPGVTEMARCRAFILDYARRLANSKEMPICTRFQTQLRLVLGIGNMRWALFYRCGTAGERITSAGFL